MKPWSHAGLVAAVLAGQPLAIPAEAVEAYRGELYCETSKDLAAIPDIVDFEVSIDGGKASYTYVEPGQIAAEVALLDRGKGTVMDGQVEMVGGASTQVWQLQSRYSGRVSKGRTVLTGTQVWQGGGLAAPVSRACDAILTLIP